MNIKYLKSIIGLVRSLKIDLYSNKAVSSENKHIVLDQYSLMEQSLNRNILIEHTQIRLL